MKISAKIIVFNEEDNIAEVCESVGWADEIVVVDSGSTDRTVEIARGFTDKIHFNKFVNFKLQHEFADSKTDNDWVFWIDADERVTPELKESILALKERDPDDLPNGFLIGRKPRYMGRWIGHSGWYPDRVLRLYRKSASSWSDNIVHESVRVDGDPGTLEGELLHYTRRNLKEHHDVIARYSELAAEFRFRKGERAGWSDFLLKPPSAFVESYLLKQGFRDGLQGLLIAYFRAYSVFLRSAFVWELQQKEANPD
ncbi:MAG TPA: glycosyltransferase family 2 protein [Aridibacter sp.]|nr:glycosyltransferase family 2 protein [Aridibacter sp.]